MDDPEIEDDDPDPLAPGVNRFLRRYLPLDADGHSMLYGTGAGSAAAFVPDEDVLSRCLQDYLELVTVATEGGSHQLLSLHLMEASELTLALLVRGRKVGLRAREALPLVHLIRRYEPEARRFVPGGGADALKRLAAVADVIEQMDPAGDAVTLRLDRGHAAGDGGTLPLTLGISVAIGTFTGNGSILVSREDLRAFCDQLDGIDGRQAGPARLECGTARQTDEVTYFMCQIEPSAPGYFLADLTLGTAGSDELLQRLHAGLRVESGSFRSFRFALRGVLEGHCDSARLRASSESLPAR